MVFPGDPRTPISCLVGLSQSPMREMLVLPFVSTWLAPINDWRRPVLKVSNTRRKGAHPAMTPPSAAVLPIGGGSDRRKEAPSVSTISGAEVSLASLAPMVGMMPTGWARSSPECSYVSVHAATQTSAVVAGECVDVIVHPAERGNARRRCGTRLHLR